MHPTTNWLKSLFQAAISQEPMGRGDNNRQKHGSGRGKRRHLDQDTNRQQSKRPRTIHQARGSRDTPERLPESPHPGKRRRTTRQDTSTARGSRDTTEQQPESLIPGRRTQQAIQDIMRTRVLVADMGHSSISCNPAVMFDKISWKNIVDTQEEQRAGLLLITGMPYSRDGCAKMMERYLPDFEYTTARTNGSDMLAAWHKTVWKELSSGTVTLSGPSESNVQKLADARTAIVLTLQRITKHGSASKRRGTTRRQRCF